MKTRLACWASCGRPIARKCRTTSPAPSTPPKRRVTAFPATNNGPLVPSFPRRREPRCGDGTASAVLLNHSGSPPSRGRRWGIHNRVKTMSTSRDLLNHLIAFNTVSRDSNLALIEFVRDYLTSLGIDSELIHSDDGRKANLYARIGPSISGGVMLSGHSDVVPVDGQAWSVPPFSMTERDGKLYGRGTADMKGYIACVLAALPAFLAKPLRVPLHLAISYDEEVGCLGVRSLIEALAGRPERPSLCIIGEPTSMRPVLGHKGKLGMRCEVHGAACHSAYAPQGV